MTNTDSTPVARIYRYLFVTAVVSAVVAVLYLVSKPCRSMPAHPLHVATTLPHTGSVPHPLPLDPSVYWPDLTWVDVQQRLREGATTVILPTGGIEQNGPYVTLNKHDLIVKEVCIRAASKAGKTLVAPVVSFVPEGSISPPSGHMQYPGTLSLSEETFVRLLSDIGQSLLTHGFKTIVILGDSGESQRGMKIATERLLRIAGPNAQVHFFHEYYNYNELREIVSQRGFRQTPEPFHEELVFSAQLLALAPKAIRYDERIQAGVTTLGGDNLKEREKLVALGEEILTLRAEKVAQLIAKITSLPAQDLVFPEAQQSVLGTTAGRFK